MTLAGVRPLPQLLAVVSAADAQRRILLPEPLPLPKQDSKDPGAALRDLLKRCAPCNLDVAQRCAEQMRNPEYTLKHFYADVCAAFPELRFYFVERGTDEKRARGASEQASEFDTHTTTSGVDGDQDALSRRRRARPSRRGRSCCHVHVGVGTFS